MNITINTYAVEIVRPLGLIQLIRLDSGAPILTNPQVNVS